MACFAFQKKEIAWQHLLRGNHSNGPFPFRQQISRHIPNAIESKFDMNHFFDQIPNSRKAIGHLRRFLPPWSFPMGRELQSFTFARERFRVYLRFGESKDAKAHAISPFFPYKEEEIMRQSLLKINRFLYEAFRRTNAESCFSVGDRIPFSPLKV